MATIIKRGQQTPTPAGDSVGGVAFDLEEMASHGDRYVANVRQEVAKIVQQANVDAKRIREEAEAAGKQAAEQAIDQVLSRKIGEQMNTLRPAIEQFVAELERARDEWLGHWEKSAIDLAGKIAERVVRREIAEHPEITVETAREALQLAAGSSEITVRLSPTDYTNLGEHVAAVAASAQKAAATEVMSDPAVSPGGCVIETRHGVIDAQVETQIQRLIDELQ